MAACTGGGSSPEQILKAAPRTDCPALLIPADGINPSQLGETMRGMYPIGFRRVRFALFVRNRRWDFRQRRVAPQPLPRGAAHSLAFAR